MAEIAAVPCNTQCTMQQILWATCVKQHRTVASSLALCGLSALTASCRLAGQLQASQPNEALLIIHVGAIKLRMVTEPTVYTPLSATCTG